MAQTHITSLHSVTSLEDDIKTCLKIAEFVLSEKSLDAFLNLVLLESVKRLRADRGSIFLVDRNASCLRGYAMTGVELPTMLQIELEQGIVGEVVSTGMPLNVRNAYLDPRFYQGVDSLTGYKTHAILCAPISSAPGGRRQTEQVERIGSRGASANKGTLADKGITPRNGGRDNREIWGALELLNPIGRDTFGEDDERSLLSIVSFAALRLQEYSNIEALLEHQERLEHEVAKVRGYSTESKALAGLVGSSPALDKLKQLIWAAAPFDSNVLISGESGTGKELVAHCLHALSLRKNNPFVALNCAAIPESLMEAELFGIESGVATGVTKRAGKIEQAAGGTLFLDEIGEMTPATQAKLLRALQEREITRVGGKEAIQVDVRFISATHRNLIELIAQKSFREDLYYRLHVVQINVPSLRERATDVALLATTFLDRLNERYPSHLKKTFAPAVLAMLSKLEWPGNVRQLQNEVERLFVVSGRETSVIESSHLTASLEGDEAKRNFEIFQDFLRQKDTCKAQVNSQSSEEIFGSALMQIATEGKTLPDIVDAVERFVIKSTLEKCLGNKSKVAEKLGISREGLRKMLARLGDLS